MTSNNGPGAAYRPADVCKALLSALEAAEGRRRSRKRDQTPDAFGLSVKRELLRRVVDADPPAADFEAWLIEYPRNCGVPELAGPASAMARAVYEDWRLAESSEEFRRWLEAGAPSADTRPSRQESSAASLAAIVLAGGHSSRMGRSKALLPFGNQPLLIHVLATLRQLFDEIVVVAAPDQELPPLPVTVVRDVVAHQGPVGGLYYGLSAIHCDAAFVTSCDSAFLNPRVIAHLVAQLPENDVVVPTWEGRPQPLHAVYRRSVLPLLQAQLERGELRPVFLFDKVRTLRVGEEEIRTIDSDGWSFFNMNTPDEYSRALERWSALQSATAAASDVAHIQCTIELFGVARLVAKTTNVVLSLPPNASVAHVLNALADRIPSLVGVVISSDRTRLVEGYACNLNGRAFVREPGEQIQSGDHIVILSADAGG